MDMKTPLVIEMERAWNDRHARLSNVLRDLTLAVDRSNVSNVAFVARENPGHGREVAELSEELCWLSLIIAYLRAGGAVDLEKLLQYIEVVPGEHAKSVWVPRIVQHLS